MEPYTVAVRPALEPFSPLIADGKKPFRLYRFVLGAAGTEGEVEFRFSTLRHLHGRLVRDGSLRYPSRHPFRDMNAPAMAGRRSCELLQYLSILLNEFDRAGSIVADPKLHRCLNCPESLREALLAVGGFRRQEHGRKVQADKVRRAEMERLAMERLAMEQARLLVLRQQQQADWAVAQNINLYGNGATMVFPRPLTFELQQNIFSLGDNVTIKGPGGFDWFRMHKRHSWVDTEVISTSAGEPLLKLKREFRWMHYQYRLERIVAGGRSLPICSVTREHKLFSPATYTITMHAPSFGGPITCRGAWFEDFVFYQDGFPACRVARRWGNCYDVVVEPQRDLLLFLGIACAVDHIHHVIEEAHRHHHRHP